VSTFDDDETSPTKSRPIDLYIIQTTSQIFHLTSHIVDVAYGGNTYTATTMSRGSQQVAQDLTGRELIVWLPITHPIVQRYAAFGVPEQSVLVTQLRFQERSGIAVQAWQGFGNAMTIKGHMAQMRVPSITDDAMKIRLPIVRAQKLCNHLLFDLQCAPPGIGVPLNKANNAYATTMASQTIAVGSVTIALTGWTRFGSPVTPPDGFFTFGEVHLGGEVRQCLTQVGMTIQVDAPFPGAVAGAAITMFPGCDHTITTCRDKWFNVVNFGGHPELNSVINPWAPSGFGVIVQS